jgi:hypothetical protein
LRTTGVLLRSLAKSPPQSGAITCTGTVTASTSRCTRRTVDRCFPRWRAAANGLASGTGKEVTSVKQTALFVGWGGVYPGRERLALDGFHEWVTILDELKTKGEIEDYQTVTLGPHGGELNGFTLVYGDPIKLWQIIEREDLRKLRLLAEHEFAKFSLIPAVIGERVDEEFKVYEEEILPILERTPVTV